MSPDPAPVRKWQSLAAMTCGLSMVFIDQTVVSVALPTIHADFGASTTEVQWVINAYILALASFVLAAGRFGDLLGNRTVFVAGVALFAAASASSGASPDETWLIASRAVQGLAAALMMPTTMTIVVQTFPRQEVGRAIAILIGVATMFLSVGPLIGGVLTSGVSWRWIFFVNLPIAAAAIVLALRSTPPLRWSYGKPHIDVPGLLTLAGALIALVLALMQAQEWGWGSSAVVGLLAAATVLLGAFGLIETRVPGPMLDFSIFRSRTFSVTTLVLFFVQFTMIAVIVFGSQYLQESLGMSAVVAGLALLPLTLPISLLSSAAPRMAGRIGRVPAVVAGLTAMAAACAWIAVLGGRGSYGWIAPALLVFGIAAALVLPVANAAGMTSVPPRQLGQAAGITSTAREMSATLGIAVLGTVLLAGERARSDRVTALGPRAIHEVQGLLVGSDQATARLARFAPARIELILATARDVFADAFASTMWIATAVALATALAALAWLRIEAPSYGPATPGGAGGPQGAAAGPSSTHPASHAGARGASPAGSPDPDRPAPPASG